MSLIKNLKSLFGHRTTAATTATAADIIPTELKSEGQLTEALARADEVVDLAVVQLALREMATDRYTKAVAAGEIKAYISMRKLTDEGVRAKALADKLSQASAD